MGHDARKPVFGGFEHKGADLPAHLRRLISAFVIFFLESIIFKLATGEISIFWLVSEAEETGLNFALLETSNTGLSCQSPYNSAEAIK